MQCSNTYNGKNFVINHEKSHKNGYNKYFTQLRHCQRIQTYVENELRELHKLTFHEIEHYSCLYSTEHDLIARNIY